jgi:hypothetical protein
MFNEATGSENPHKIQRDFLGYLEGQLVRQDIIHHPAKFGALYQFCDTASLCFYGQNILPNLQE